MFKTTLLTRIYVTLSVLFTTLTMTFDKNSLGWISLHFTNAPSIFMYLAIFLCSLSVFDIIVNDLMSDGYKLCMAFSYRHITYMSMGILSVSLSVGVISTFGSTFFVCKLWLDGIMAAVIAFLDIFERHGYSGSSIHIRSN
jgi:hypothetical protein